jgi:Bacteriophage T4-like capsid assembly protein (Gp20).
LIDINSPKKGLLELRAINPTEIKKVREVIKELDPVSRVEIITGVEEYFIYGKDQNEIRVSPDAICHVTSGLIDRNNGMVLSHLHKAIRPANQLRMTENAQVIYRLARAPERRIFYIDVGNMPKAKAEQHLKDIMDRYRNKMVYDANSGTLINSSDEMSMMEDFWLPRREGGKGTEITTLPAGTNLADIDDIIYFQKKLFKSLNVPVSRLDSESSYTFGSGSEVTRDEVKFSKFIAKIRRKFSNVFDDLLRTQLILKGVINESEWDKLKEVLSYRFTEDNYYAELKDSEIMRERISTLEALEPYIGKFFSNDYVRKVILKQTDEDILDINSKIKKEVKDPLYKEDEEDDEDF